MPLSVLSSDHIFGDVAEPDDDAELVALLDLHGWVSEVGGGFWVKICARRVPANELKPHGIDYSLSLHKPDGQRVIGYDNAHPLMERHGMRSSRTVTGDHKHYRDQIQSYRFVDAGKLMEDFWEDVIRLLEEEGAT